MKTLLAAVLLLVVGLALSQTFQVAEGTVAGIDAPATVAPGSPITVRVYVSGPDTTEATQVTLTGLGSGVSGSLVVTDCNPDCPSDVGKAANNGSNTLSVNQDSLDEITLVLVMTSCTSNALLTITADPNETDSSSTVVTCGGSGGNAQPTSTPTSGGSVGIIPGLGQFALTADPNLLPCVGGSSVLTAEVLKMTSASLNYYEVHFVTTAGTLVQSTNSTARLTLGANQVDATVTATLYYEIGNTSGTTSATVHVSLDCNGSDANQTLVVTASPNVIDCTGTTTITASVRDVNGHVVTGRGYHFATSAGLLQVDPNDASTEEGVATLSLKPGDGDATVTVSSGLLYGTYEEIDDVENNFVVDETAMVTVKQNCLSTTTGQITLNSSSVSLACGERVFIGLSVIDENIQTVVDATPLTLISTGGGNGGFFVGSGGDGGAASEVIMPQVSVNTSHGEANAIYVAPTDYNGEIKITAASGDTYGTRKLTVSGCGVTAPASSAPSAPPAATAVPCTPIGDGICITPPNTGRSAITPPNTGSAGLK